MTLSMEMGNDYTEVKELCQSYTKRVEKGELLHPPLICAYADIPLHDVCCRLIVRSICIAFWFVHVHYIRTMHFDGQYCLNIVLEKLFINMIKSS